MGGSVGGGGEWGGSVGGGEGKWGGRESGSRWEERVVCLGLGLYLCFWSLDSHTNPYGFALSDAVLQVADG